jgi:hypothetical protein
MTRKTIRRALLALALGVLLGAGFALVGFDQSAVTVDTNAPTLPQWRRDSVYITALRARDIEGTDADLFTTGRAICRDAGDRNLLELVDSVQQRLDLDAPDAAFVVGTAVRVQCPEKLAVLGEPS